MSDIYEILKKYYGYSSFRKGQEEIIQNILNGRDVAAVMPTGAGKSICYQVPALAFDGITIVVSPLISLMQDQVRTLVSMGIRAAYLNSTLTPRQMALATQNARNGVYKIIYAAPERLETDSFLDFAANNKISLLAVDEAHCISQWGHDFRPSYTNISSFIEKLPERPVVAAFTATATEQVKKDIIRNLKLHSPYTTTTGFDRQNLYFGTFDPDSKIGFLRNYLSQNEEKSGIIYCNTRRDVEMLALTLSSEGYSILPYHAGMSDSDRQHNQNEFIYDRTKIIVATSAFGMGIDKPNVRFVIHFNMPINIEEYYQQAGRAGRDGEPSECILLYHGTDVYTNKFIIQKNSDNEIGTYEERQRQIQHQLNNLKLMVFYSTSTEICLRKRILNYFGENFYPPCGNCSVCNHESRSHFSRIRPLIKVQDRSGKPLIADEALLERLKKKRSSLALAAGIPGFAVLSDKTLRELAARSPLSVVELTEISGFGESKIRRYGQAFIETITDYQNDCKNDF